MIAREKGDKVLIECPDYSCGGEGSDCVACDGTGTVERTLAEDIEIDEQAVSEQFAQQRGGA